MTDDYLLLYLGVDLRLNDKLFRCYDADIDANLDYNYAAFYLRDPKDINYQPILFVCPNWSYSLHVSLRNCIIDDENVDKFGTLYEFDKWEHSTLFLDHVLELV